MLKVILTTSKIATLTTALALAVSVMVVSPVHAAAPSDGKYLCTTGEPESSTLVPRFTITNGVVSGGNSCVDTVVIPEGVTSIGDYAFTGASSLTSITIPAGVTSIGDGAFQNATALTNIIIPASVTTIGDLAFANTILLTNITVDTENANYSSTEGVLFNKNLTTLINYPTGNSRTSYSIPASVTSIRDSAFYGVTLLSSVYFLGNAPTVGDNTFSGIASGSKAYIKSTATGFTTTGTPARWNGLTVEVVVDTPAPATETPPANTAGSVVDNSAARPAAALLAARTLGFKKSFAIKTLAKRVGIKIVSSKATVSLTVSKTSKKVCAASKFKLNTLKAGKCKATFTVQEPTPKKGKKPKARKTTMTLVVK